jgi:hypothetical protein
MEASHVLCVVCGHAGVTLPTSKGFSTTENYTSHMNKSEIMNILRDRMWTVSALADRWGFSRRHVTAKIADNDRGGLWNDAFKGLPVGPGFYRRGVHERAARGRPAPVELVIGSLVASEADMDTFNYGSRGIVVEVLSGNRWTVIWDGGQEMLIDEDCLSDWVVDLGLVGEGTETWKEFDRHSRIELARNFNLHG